MSDQLSKTGKTLISALIDYWRAEERYSKNLNFHDKQMRDFLKGQVDKLIKQYKQEERAQEVGDSPLLPFEGEDET